MSESTVEYELPSAETGFLFGLSGICPRLLFLCLLFLLICFCFPSAFLAQPKIAVLVPEKSEQSRIFAGKIEDALSKGARVLDSSLSEAAFKVQAPANPFNLSRGEAKKIGAAIGCDFFLLVKAANLRRISLSKGEFYESYAAIYTVETRAGKLVFWKLFSFEAAKATKADDELFDSAKTSASEILSKLKNTAEAERAEKTALKFETLPEKDSLEAKNFRPPLPYKRFRPEYTPLAALYGVEAIIDAEIDVDENGKILKIEIVRWAGFGLDESVADNIRRMNWRPAERNGKSLPTRVLLRYNFKKINSE